MIPCNILDPRDRLKIEQTRYRTKQHFPVLTCCLIQTLVDRAVYCFSVSDATLHAEAERERERERERAREKERKSREERKEGKREERNTKQGKQSQQHKATRHEYKKKPSCDATDHRHFGKRHAAAKR